MGNGLGMMLGGSISDSNYVFSEQTWVSLGGYIVGEAAGDGSGISVSLSGDGTIVAIGAVGNDGNGSASGHVRVYQIVTGSWNQIGSDIDGELASDESGISVSLSSDGTIVAIGAVGNDGNGSASGHVRVYQIVTGSWNQIGSDIDGELASDESGISVSLSSDGTIVAIGAWLNDGNGSASGHVRVYEYTAGTWTQMGSDIDGEAIGDQSGFSVSLSDDGTIVAIGAYFNDGAGANAGHVRVYQNVAGTWTQIGSDIDGEAAGDFSGVSVSLSADGLILAIGAYFNDEAGANAGHVRVYQNVAGTWTQMGSDIDGKAGGDYSGYSVSLSDNGLTLAIGASKNSGNGSASGHVRVYKYMAGAWTQVGVDIDGEAADDNSGYSVSLNSNGTTVAIGSPYNDGNGSNSGKVHVYKLI
jgi:Flp pilus assembly pilin Flp